MEKKNNNLIIIIIILVIMVLGLSGFIIYDKVLNKNSNVDNNINDKNNSVDNNIKDVNNDDINNNDIRKCTTNDELGSNYANLSIKEKFEKKAANCSSVSEYIEYLLSFTPWKYTDHGKLQSLDKSYLNDNKKISLIIYKYIRDNIRNSQNATMDADYNYIAKAGVDEVNKVLKDYYDISDFDFVPLYINDTGAYGIEKVNNEYLTKTAGTEFSFPSYGVGGIDYDDNLVTISIVYAHKDNPDDSGITQNGKLILEYRDNNFKFVKIEFE